MKPTFKKLEVPDLSNLEKLIAENIGGIEPGLRVIDARLCLGQAAIDLVALDAREALVLVALDFTADEGLLLRVDRKSTRLNSSHLVISYAVFCLKKKKEKKMQHENSTPYCTDA